MAQVNVSFSELRQLVGGEFGQEEAIEQLTMLGFPAEEREGGMLTVEVTPNRPDALCAEGIARALRIFRTGKPATFSVGVSSVSVTVDASVEDVRPAFGCAVVRGVRMNEAALVSMMQLQEKLHDTLGRKRRKVAIGLHDLGKTRPPFRYAACGREEISFVPLDSGEKMTPLEILRRHGKGMSYAHLVSEKCPMITDSAGEVLSFPPIINSERTKLALSTSDIFIDCTGTSNEAVRQAVNIIAAALADRGGRVETASVNGTPYAVLGETSWPIPATEAKRLLGIELGEEELWNLLSKMGHRVQGASVFTQGYRVDIISEVDLVEEVAIAYGLNNFEPKLPPIATIGNAAAQEAFHEILLGLGFEEAVSWMLSNKEADRKAAITEAGYAEIENPLTEDFTVFRSSLLPNMLSIFADSKNEKLPIRIYEEGPVAAPRLERRLCFGSMHPKASFSEIKGVVLSLSQQQGKEIALKEDEYGPFMRGRCAAVYLDGNRAGFIGEISPEVLSAFGLEQPVCAAEIRI